MNNPKHIRRLPVFLVPLGVALVALSLLLKGLGTPLPTPAPPTPTPDRAQEIVAHVGSQRITFADWAVAFYLDALMSHLSGQPVPTASETLDRLVNDALMLAAATEEGIAASNTDVEARIALLESVWGLTDEQVVAELAAIGLTRQIWADAIARLLTVERYLKEVVWLDTPVEGQSEALGDWLQTHRAQTRVEIDTQGLQPSLPPFEPVPTAMPLTPPPTATATLSPTATPLAASPLVAPSPTPTVSTVQVSPLQTPVVSPSATLSVDPVVLPKPSGPLVVGRPAPGFSLTDADGQLVSLSDYRDQRRVVIVFFRTSG